MITGTKLNLYKMFSWFDSTPKNQTAQEKGLVFGQGGVNGTGGGISPHSYYQQQVTPGAGQKERMGEWAEMASHETITPIIETYAEECTQPDFQKGLCGWFECTDSVVERDCNEMLKRIEAEDAHNSISFNVAAIGNEFRRVLWNNTDGVIGFAATHVGDVHRIYETNSRRLVGFDWVGHEASDAGCIEVAGKKIFAPWEFIHFRRLASNIFTEDSEYGVGMLAHMFPLYRRIKLSLDQMVMYRANMMPSRLAVEVYTGTKTVTESAEYLNEYINLFNGLMAGDAQNGQFTTRYNPMAMDSILFIPKPEGDKSTVTTLTGQNDVPDVPDITTLLKLLHGGARVPRAYLGFEDDSNGLSKNSLVNQDLRFARMIRVLRRPLINGWTRLGNIHLAVKGKDPSQYDLRFCMSRISSLESEVDSEVFQTQVNAASQFVDMCKNLGVSNKEAAEIVFKNLLTSVSDHADAARLAAAVSSGGISQDLGLESFVAPSTLTEASKLFSLVGPQPLIGRMIMTAADVKKYGRTSLVESDSFNICRSPSVLEGMPTTERPEIPVEGLHIPSEGPLHEAVELKRKMQASCAPPL